MQLRLLLGNGNQLLSCKQIIEQYKLEQTIAEQCYKPEMETVEFWLDRVSKGVIFIKGLVKPTFLHPKWISVTCMNGDVLRYLDFDPAFGGTPGQVIEVDVESCTYEVLASSFENFLKLYAQQLSDGVYEVDDEGYIERTERELVTEWGVPNWLK